MTQQLPILIVVIPLLSAVVTPLAGLWKEQASRVWVLCALGACLLCSVGILHTVTESGIIHYRLGGWSPPWGIEFVIDGLNALMLVIIAGASLLAAIHSGRSIERELPGKTVYFHTVFLLQVTGFFGIAVTGDMFNVYVFLEITSIAGYALIAVGRGWAAMASFRYLIMGTIGACFYLLGVGYLYMMTGTLNMADLAALLPPLYGSKLMVFAFGFIIAGLAVKMAFFPMHGWLPNAYSHAPSAVSSLIAPLTTKVMVYVMVRVCLFVFTPEFCFSSIPVGDYLVWAAVAAIVVGSLLALAQTSLKKTLTHIIVAEVGYMVGGFWLGTRAGVTGAILHIINDAAMTLCVFLAAGTIVHRIGSDSFEDLKGIFRRMPLTMAAFAVGGLSIIGVPPTCGFFSKWYLISGGIEAGRYDYVAALLFSSLVNVVIFFRIFEIGFFEPFTDHHGGGTESAAVRGPFEATGKSMLAPLMIAASIVVLLGLATNQLVQHCILTFIPAGL